MANTDYDGRRASFDRKGNVRGFRSKPGAPMADPLNNIPMSADRRTPKENWDSRFTNSLTGNNPLSPEARAPAPVETESAMPPTATSGPVDTAMNEILGFKLGPPPLPSLGVLAAGGPTHAQSWGGESLGMPGSPIMGKSFKNRYGTGSVSFDKRLSGGYGWGSNSRVT